MSDSAGEDRRDDLVRAQLARILASEDFPASARNRRFLEYVVTETLAGRADRIKAYTLATDVFERAADFDPQVDPVVRLEASRLRRALEHYYLTSGRTDSVRLSIPKGSYVPTVDFLATTAPRSADDPSGTAPSESGAPSDADGKRRWRRATIALAAALVIAMIALGWQFASRRSGDGGRVSNAPAIFVVPFSNGANELERRLAQGLTVGMISNLTRFSDLFVFAAETSLQQDSLQPDAALITQLKADYLVRGRVGVWARRFRATISLVEAKTGRYLWSEQFEGELAPKDIFDKEEEISSRVARTLAQPYGVIFSNRIKEVQGKPPQSLTSYECVLSFQLHRRDEDLRSFDQIEACLKRSIRDDPVYAEAHASLSMLYTERIRIELGRDRIDHDRARAALDLAKQALKINPSATSGYLAQMAAHWYLGDAAAAFAAGRRGLALNPNNTQMLANLGARLCVAGNWAEGLPMLEQAFARNPVLGDAYHYIFALDRYRRGDYEGALRAAQDIDLPDDLLTYVFLAMAHAALGQDEDAHRAIARLVAIDPDFGDHVVQSLAARNFDADLIDMIAAGLAKAGLDVKAAPAK